MPTETKQEAHDSVEPDDEDILGVLEPAPVDVAEETVAETVAAVLLGAPQDQQEGAEDHDHDVVVDHHAHMEEGDHSHHQYDHPPPPPPQDDPEDDLLPGVAAALEDDIPPPEPTGTVVDPLAPEPIVDDAAVAAPADHDQAALDAGEEAAAAAMEAAVAAEAAIGNVLDDVGVDVHSVTAPGIGATHHVDVVDAAHQYTEVEHHQMAVDHHPHHYHHQYQNSQEDDDVALAAAAAAAAVQAADGMAVVVDQALLATAAAAAASQVAEVLADQPDDLNGDMTQDMTAGSFPTPLRIDTAATKIVIEPQYLYDDLGSPLKPGEEHGDLLEARRQKDRKRYSAMTPEARAAYNAHRRELYHKQGENARKRRRERERERYHSLEGDNKKCRNERRAKLERDRYNRLSKDELAQRNAKRRDRAKDRKSVVKEVVGQLAVAPLLQQPEGPLMTAIIVPPPVEAVPQPIKAELAEDGAEGVAVPHIADVVVPHEEGLHHEADAVAGAPLPEATIDVHDAHHHEAAMADASALAAEVAEQVIAGTNLEGAMAAVGQVHALAAASEEDEGPTVQI